MPYSSSIASESKQKVVQKNGVVKTTKLDSIIFEANLPDGHYRCYKYRGSPETWCFKNYVSLGAVESEQIFKRLRDIFYYGESYGGAQPLKKRQKLYE